MELIFLGDYIRRRRENLGLHRGSAGGGHIALPYHWCLKESAVTGKPVDTDTLRPQDIHADLKGGHGGVELGPEEIGKGKAAFRCPGHQGPPGIHMGDAFPG